MKYIIEIEDEPFGRNDDPVIPHGMDELYRAKGFNSLVFDQNGLEKLTPLDNELEEAYQRGLNDAWKAAIKIVVDSENGGYTYEQLEEGFGIRNSHKILCNMTPSEVISKIKAYEEKKKAESEIKIGDEVAFHTGRRFIVVSFTETERACGVSEDGCWTAEYKKDLKKTGRHFPEVAQLLEAMKGEKRNCSTCKYIHNMLMCNTCYEFNKWQPKEGAE